MSRLSIRIGEALIDWRGCDVTVAQVSELVDLLAAKAEGIEQEADPEPDRPPLGFALVIGDKAGDPPVEHFYSDDEE